MARIAGINIPPNQHAEIGLMAIYGYRPRAGARDPASVQSAVRQEDQGANGRRARAHSRSRQPRQRRGRSAARDPVVDQATDRSGSYRAYGIARGLPVRGQRTRTNARTRKGHARQACR